MLFWKVAKLDSWVNMSSAKTFLWLDKISCFIEASAIWKLIVTAVQAFWPGPVEGKSEASVGGIRVVWELWPCASAMGE